ncbi:MAG: hypothetical protein QS748_03325 [Candidatus Endonucleobacter bathymodioli]|uniref:Uncharacterized protein n=1 Tax=Candidatus Endonucleibacter bathymodioli TaxID=539814 RepID=A0AA90NZP6_9GAMM|nr:hypothetical protein [Candidatus Endonucleobacter bathymodioli]
MNKELSQQIFKVGQRGELINKLSMTATGLAANPLYREIFENETEYRELYNALPFDLVPISGEAYFICESEQDAPYMVVARNIQVLLDLIARGLQMCGLMPELLDPEGFGLNRDYIDRFDKEEEFSDILYASGMGRKISAEIENVLIRRQIANWNQSNQLVLTTGGSAFFRELHQEDVVIG